MISVKNSYEIAYNGTENECRFELYADSAADLQGLTHIDGIKIQMGSECTDISTGDKYILNGSGAWILQPSANAFSNVYTKPEIDSMITEIYGVIAYYHTVIVSDTGEITFYALAGYIGTLKIYGNGQQTGTPTPDNPVMPEFCGRLSGSDWTIPITCAGQTVPVYLGQVSTVRRVQKLVFDGTEQWQLYKLTEATNVERFYLVVSKYAISPASIISTHFPTQAGNSDTEHTRFGGNPMQEVYIYISRSVATTVEALKSWLTAQYAAGTPVTVWYVLATPRTAIVNEPLCKIGTYADELSSTDAAVTIPTVKGSNTLTVDTELQPSLIEISGGIMHE